MNTYAEHVNAQLLAALREIARLRLATSEGSLRVRADRMWDIASGALRAFDDPGGQRTEEQAAGGK